MFDKVCRNVVIRLSRRFTGAETIREVILFPTMKPLDIPKKEDKPAAAPAAQAEEDLDQLLQGLRGAEAAPAAPEPQPRPGEAAQQEDGGAFARLFDDQAWDRYYGSPEAETPAAEPESVTESAAEPAPVSEPVFVPENPTPVPPVSQSAPQPAAPDLNQTLAADGGFDIPLFRK